METLEFKADNLVTNKIRITKKIPIDQKRINFVISNELNYFKKIFFRIKNDSQYFRLIIQFTFLILVLWIGYEFHLFVKWGLSNGRFEYYERPPGVEGFLPISAFMSLLYWIKTGILNDIHPSSVYIFLAIILVSFFAKKSFCSWLCPVGTVSESLWKFGQKLFKKNIVLPKFLDWPLRSIKYFLLLFFVWAILAMSSLALENFIYSPYNKVSDIKMYLFFAEISTFSISVILVLIILSIIIKNFWCRYLCPYGALLGALSFLSPFKITRNEKSCIDCELCTKACPSNVSVHKVKQVWSDECTGCLSCVEVCPVKNTLDLRTNAKSKFVLSNYKFGLIVIIIFSLITGFAIITNNWKNSISKEEYLYRFGKLESPIYEHNRGSVPNYKKAD